MSHFNTEHFLDELRDRFGAYEVMWATKSISPSQIENMQEEIIERLEQETSR